MRTRISTTVDADRLEAARKRLDVVDSQLFDRALSALLDQLDAAVEMEALDRWPYEFDADLAWNAPAVPSLPYDGDVPADVVELARRRAARR